MFIPNLSQLDTIHSLHHAYSSFIFSMTTRHSIIPTQQSPCQPTINIPLFLGIILGKSLQPLRSMTLGPLQRQSQCPIPIQLAQTTHSPRHTKQHGVILILGESIMPQQHSRMRIDIGIRVGNLPMLRQNTRHDRINRFHNLEQGIIRHMLQPKLTLTSVSRIRLPQHSMSIPRNNLLGIQSLPRKLGNRIGIHLLPLRLKLGLQRLNPLEYLLIGQSVQWSRQGIQSRRIGQVWITQCRSYQMCRVGTGIPPLVIGMDTQIQSHQFIKTGIIVSQHTTEVTRIIQGLVLVNHPVKVDIAVNLRGNFGNDGKDIEDIFQCILVVLVFGYSIGICLGEFRCGLSRIETNAELGHGVHILG
mmetsp:Transcript_25494/g.42073  ORF Transcript_25494/g.42073 Transcript_25494/m.42073 type:complete len:359 (+) Transcript_25494:70-1146(+)